MADFEINKGVGREVEFKGLRAQYLFIFAAGLLAVFVMFVIMYMAGRRTVNLHRFRGIGGYGTSMADLYAEP